MKNGGVKESCVSGKFGFERVRDEGLSPESDCVIEETEMQMGNCRQA